jgi:beta-galactosidase/beta-glucuronidase
VHPLRGRSLTPELCRKDAELFRSANINFVRTSHYPPSEEFLDACDELGIFVEDEAPFCWAFRWVGEEKNDPKYLKTIVQQTMEMVQRDRSHPCIIIWSAANESVWSTSFE